MPAKEAPIEIDGVVVEVNDHLFKVTLDNGATIDAHLSGKLRKHRVRVLIDDRVQVELSPYDLTRGKIVYRHKN